MQCNTCAYANADAQSLAVGMELAWTKCCQIVSRSERGDAKDLKTILSIPMQMMVRWWCVLDMPKIHHSTNIPSRLML